MSEGSNAQSFAQQSRSFCPQLTSARFFAAAYVVIFHYHNEVFPLGPNGELSLIRNLVDRGYIGVTFFFILSGYILSLNYLDKLKEKAVSIGSFFVARFARLYPLYIASVIACIPYAFMNPYLMPHGESVINLRENAFSASVMYLFCAESLWPAGVGRFLVLPSWSISTEFSFYLLFPVFAWVVNRLNRTQAKVGLILVGLFALAYAVVYHFVSMSRILFFLPPETADNINTFVYQSVVSGIHANWTSFAVGMLAYRAFEGELSQLASKWLPRLLGFFLVASTLWYMLQPVHLRVDLFILSKNVDCLPLCTLAILWLHKGSGKLHTWLGHSKLVLLGEISYALYLVHSPIRLASRFLIYKPLGIPEASPLFYIPLWIISLVVAWLAWKYIEVPARRKILKAWKEREARRTQPAAV